MVTWMVANDVRNCKRRLASKWWLPLHRHIFTTWYTLDPVKLVKTTCAQIPTAYKQHICFAARSIANWLDSKRFRVANSKGPMCFVRPVSFQSLWLAAWSWVEEEQNSHHSLYIFNATIVRIFGTNARRMIPQWQLQQFSLVSQASHALFILRKDVQEGRSLLFSVCVCFPNNGKPGTKHQNMRTMHNKMTWMPWGYHLSQCTSPWPLRRVVRLISVLKLAEEHSLETHLWLSKKHPGHNGTNATSRSAASTLWAQSPAPSASKIRFGGWGSRFEYVQLHVSHLSELHQTTTPGAKSLVKSLQHRCSPYQSANVSARTLAASHIYVLQSNPAVFPWNRDCFWSETIIGGFTHPEKCAIQIAWSSQVGWKAMLETTNQWVQFWGPRILSWGKASAQLSQ